MKVMVLVRKPTYRCETCGRAVRDLDDHLPRCPALGMVNGDAWRQRAEKAEAALAAFGRHVLEDHRVGTPGYDQMMVMARAAGRDSGGTKTEVSPAGNTAPSRGSGDRGQPSGLGQKSAAAKSAAREECGT